MNNIHEKDWEEENWSGHNLGDDKSDAGLTVPHEAATNQYSITEQE